MSSVPSFDDRRLQAYYETSAKYPTAYYGQLSRTKLGIDATVPFAERARFARCEFKPVEVDAKAMTTDAAVARKRLDL
jgi:hypothetical protein